MAPAARLIDRTEDLVKKLPMLRKGDEAASRVIPVTHGEPIRFGPAGDDGLGTYAVVQEGFGLRVAKADEIDDSRQIVVHDATDHELAFALSRLSDQDLTHTVTGIFRVRSIRT